VALGVVVGLLWSFAKIAIGLLLRAAIDRGIEADDMGALARWAAAIFVVGSLSAVLTGTRRYLAFREARWVEKALRDRLFAHVQRLHFAYHDEVQAGQLMSRGNIDLQHLQNFVVMIPLTIANAMTVLGVTVILVAIDPLLAAASLAALPLINVVAKRFGTKLFPSVMGIQRESAELASVVEESVAGVRVVKGFGAEDVVRARLRTTADDVYRESMTASRIRSVYLPALELLPNVGLITNIISCPGGDFCALANAKSIPVAQAIQERFDDLDYQHDIGELDLNISGCMNACGHHHVGHIGILGVDKNGEEWYQVEVGGSQFPASLGKVIGPAFARADVPDVIEKLVLRYLAEREGEHERFVDVVHRIGIEPFKEAVYGRADPKPAARREPAFA